MNEQRRVPSPWVTVPTLIGGLVGGMIGYSLTRILCAEGTCMPSSVLVGLLCGLGAAAGFGTIAVLALRSIQEWQSAKAEGGPMPTVGCEVPEDD